MVEGTDAFKQITNICSDCGITLVLNKELKGTYAHGVTKWLTPEKAMIMIGLRGSYSDVVWFSLFHEIGHIVLHGKRFNYSTATKKEEKEADDYAANILIPDNEYFNFAGNYQISKANIISFAKSIEIEPGVVLGRLAHDKKIHFSEYSEYSDLKRRYKWKN